MKIYERQQIYRETLVKAIRELQTVEKRRAALLQVIKTLERLIPEESRKSSKNSSPGCPINDR